MWSRTLTYQFTQLNQPGQNSSLVGDAIALVFQYFTVILNDAQRKSHIFHSLLSFLVHFSGNPSLNLRSDASSVGHGSAEDRFSPAKERDLANWRRRRIRQRVRSFADEACQRDMIYACSHLRRSRQHTALLGGLSLTCCISFGGRPGNN